MEKPGFVGSERRFQSIFHTDYYHAVVLEIRRRLLPTLEGYRFAEAAVKFTIIASIVNLMAGF